VFSIGSGLSGIFLCLKKDSRRASLAGMTYFWLFTIRYGQTLNTKYTNALETEKTQVYKMQELMLTNSEFTIMY
jgi:hypothetical protein